MSKHQISPEDRAIARWAYIPRERQQRVLDALRRAALTEVDADSPGAQTAAQDLLAAAELLAVGARVMRVGDRLTIRRGAER